MRASAISHFFSAGIFEIRLGDYSPIRAFFLRWLRVVIFAFHGFIKDGCSSRASLLTYYSLFAIVPVLAMAFGIARGFGLERLAEARTAQMAQGMNWPPEVIGQVISFSRTMLAKTSGGLIAGIGFVALFWSVLSILRSIEQTLNDIWQVRESRTMVRRVTDYLSVIVFTPILIVISGSATIFLESEVAVISRRFPLLGDFGPVIYVALGALPYLSICGMLILTYLIIPNTRVRVRSAVAAALLTAAIYQSSSVRLYQVPVRGRELWCDLRRLRRGAPLHRLAPAELDDRPVRRGDRGSRREQGDLRLSPARLGYERLVQKSALFAGLQSHIEKVRGRRAAVVALFDLASPEAADPPYQAHPVRAYGRRAYYQDRPYTWTENRPISRPDRQRACASRPRSRRTSTSATTPMRLKDGTGATGWLPFWKGWRRLRQGCPKTCCSKRYEAWGQSISFKSTSRPVESR